MLEVKVPGFRNGYSYKAGEALLMGTVGYISGIDSSGYFLIKAPSTSTTAALTIYPFKKYTDDNEGSDTASAYESIPSGSGLVVFEGFGEYVTDKFVHTGLVNTSSTQLFHDSAQYASMTSTAHYTTYGTKMKFLYPCITAGKLGYLAGTSTNAGFADAAYTGTQIKPSWNKNFILVRPYSGMYINNSKIAFRTVPSSPVWGGMYVSSTNAANGNPTLEMSPYYNS